MIALGEPSSLINRSDETLATWVTVLRGIAVMITYSEKKS